MDYLFIFIKIKKAVKKTKIKNVTLQARVEDKFSKSNDANIRIILRNKKKLFIFSCFYS